jgi:hypothetical protein
MHIVSNKLAYEFFIKSLDTFRLRGVNSLRWKISMKGARGMSMYSINTTLIFNPDVAGVLPYRSAPVDR